MIMLSHEGKCYPMDENIFDFYSWGIIGIGYGHVINIIIYKYDRGMCYHFVPLVLDSRCISTNECESL